MHPRSLLLFSFLSLFSLASGRGESIVLVAGGGQAEKDAPALECKLHEPFAVEFKPGGGMWIAEFEKGQRVLEVDAAGRLTVLAGTGVKGYSGDGGPAAAATFNGIHNLAVTPAGDLFVSDAFNHAIRRIDGKTRTITTFAGSKQGFAGDGEAAAAALFNSPIQIALDAGGKHLFIADIGNRRIRRIDLATGITETVAGNGKKGVPQDGADAKDSPLVDPRDVIPDAAGGFYLLERGGHAMRHVDAAGKIKTVAGTGKAGLSGDGGPALAATMSGPKHLCLDRDGTVLIADTETHTIRRYSPKTGIISRVAGTGTAGSAGVGGDPLKCELKRPHGVTIGPDGLLYISDSENDRVLKIVP